MVICGVFCRNLPLLGRVWSGDMSKISSRDVFWPFSDFGILWLPKHSWVWFWSFKSKFYSEKIFLWPFWSITLLWCLHFCQVLKPKMSTLSPHKINKSTSPYTNLVSSELVDLDLGENINNPLVEAIVKWHQAVDTENVTNTVLFMHW